MSPKIIKERQIMIYTPLDMPFNFSTYDFQSHCGSADITLRTNLKQADKQKQLVRNRRMTVNVKEPYRHLSKIEIVPLRREGCEHV